MTEKLDLKPLSYEPLKAIMSYMNFDTREKIRRRMVSCKKTNAVVPYTFYCAHLSNGSRFQINDNKWEFPIEHRRNNFDGYSRDSEKVYKIDFSNSEISRRPVRAFVNFNQLRLLYSQLAFTYIRDGTRIRKLVYEDLPMFLEYERGDFKLHISELELYRHPNPDKGMTVEKYQKILPYIQDSMPLRKVTMHLTRDTRPLLSDPLISSCERLYLTGSQWFPSENQLLPQKHVYLQLTEIDVDLIHHTATFWKRTEKPIGSTFTSTHRDHDFVVSALLDLKSHCGATMSRLPGLGTDLFSRCAIIPLTETSEIVAFAEKVRRLSYPEYEFVLKMEVRPRGSTKAS